MNDTPRPDPSNDDGNVFSRLWRAGSERTVELRRHGRRFLTLPLNLAVILIAALLIALPPAWPLVVLLAVAVVAAKIDIVIVHDTPPRP